jgi:formylglycine-generating enzyme required for sulfatase activity
MKNVLMYDKHNIEKPIIELNERSWSYEYYTSQSVFPNGRYGLSESSLNPIRLIPFNYKGIEFNMITCPAGGVVDIEYWGSENEGWGPQEIKESFMLGETEVTQELFESVMRFNYSKFKTSDKNPVEHVTWYDCLDFCNRLSDYFGLDHCYVLDNKEYTKSEYPLSIEKANVTFVEGANGFRLPKEWEWQIVAMAGTNNLYAGANDDASLKRVAWFEANSENETHPVAQKLPNEWGFYDMCGNLMEWCENSDKPDNNNNPSALRVYRGGGWNNYASRLRSANRYYYSPSFRADALGFRVARSI